MINDASQSAALDKVALNTKASVVWESIKDKTLDQQKSIIREMKSKGELDKKLYDAIVSAKTKSEKSLSSTEYKLLDLQVSTGDRAKMMVKLLDGKSEEEKKEKLNRWKQNKVLTKEVWKQYNYYLKNK
jgi:hypothetical protein